MGKIFNSNYFYALLVALSVSAFTFRFEIIAMAILFMVASFGFLFVRSLNPSFLSLFLACMVPLRFYGATTQTFISLGVFGVITIICLFLRLLIFPIKYKPSALFFTQIGYSIALCLGGVGYLTAREYFSLVPFYTVIGLGFLQLFFIMYFSSYYKNADDKKVSDFARMMVALGINCFLFFLLEYLMNIPKFNERGFYLIYVAWKNNVGNAILLSMPFSFYFIMKNKKPILNSIFICLLVVTLLVSKSRGAALFGCVVFVLGAIYIFIKAEKINKKQFGIVLSIFVIAGIVLLIIDIKDVIAVIQQCIKSKSSGRFNIYKIAIDLFKDNPIFGIGFYYKPVYGISILGEKMVVTLFHSTFFQILGSLGIFGLIAFIVMDIYKWKQLLYNNLFSRISFLAVLGFSLYSMINTGTVVPFPFMTIVTMIVVICYEHNKYNLTKKEIVLAKI